MVYNFLRRVYITPWGIATLKYLAIKIEKWPSVVNRSGVKSGRFRKFNSQKIFSKNRFDRKYLGKHHGIGSFANQNSSVMVNSN